MSTWYPGARRRREESIARIKADADIRAAEIQAEVYREQFARQAETERMKEKGLTTRQRLIADTEIASRELLKQMAGIAKPNTKTIPTWAGGPQIEEWTGGEGSSGAGGKSLFEKMFGKSTSETGMVESKEAEDERLSMATPRFAPQREFRHPEVFGGPQIETYPGYEDKPPAWDDLMKGLLARNAHSAGIGEANWLESQKSKYGGFADVEQEQEVSPATRAIQEALRRKKKTEYEPEDYMWYR